jgi:hypothetical protein
MPYPSMNNNHVLVFTEQINTGSFLFTETNRNKCALQMPLRQEHIAIGLNPRMITIYNAASITHQPSHKTE